MRRQRFNLSVLQAPDEAWHVVLLSRKIHERCLRGTKCNLTRYGFAVAMSIIPPPIFGDQPADNLVHVPELTTTNGPNEWRFDMYRATRKYIDQITRSY